MGGGTEIVKSAQVVGLSKKFGTLKKKILLENGKNVPEGMNEVIKSRGQSIVDIKSMYNKKYLEAMGYAPNDNVLIEKISEGKVLEYTKNSIDSEATYVSNIRVNTLDALDQAILELQDKSNFKKSEMSFTHTDDKKYYYFTSVQNGSYIDISCFMDAEDTVTPYLENKYPEGYAILEMNSYPLIDEGSAYWKAEVEYIYYEDEIVEEEEIIDGEVVIIQNIVTYQKIGLVTEYIDCIFIYFTVLDEEEEQMYAIAQEHSGPFNITGSYTYEESDGDGGSTTRTITRDVYGTFTVTYLGNGEFSYKMDAPDPENTTNDPKRRDMAWANGVSSYQNTKMTQITQAIKDNVRKLIWDYGVDRADLDSVKRTYVLGNMLKNFTVQEQADAYPIIPLKRDFNLVNSRNMDIVLKKIGMEGKDFHNSMEQKEIRDAYLFFGIPFNSSNPGLIQYVFEFFATVVNVRQNYNKYDQNRSADSVNITFDGMGIHQSYTVSSWVVVEPATRPVGTYWFQNVDEMLILGYENKWVYDENEGGEEVAVPITETRTYGEYYYQESEAYYIRIRPTSIQYWYKLGGVNWGNIDNRRRYSDDDNGRPEPWGGVAGGADNDIELRLPILKEITNKMDFNLLCDVVEQSMSIAVYAEQEVETKWYQTMLFKFIVYAIMIVTQQYWMLAIAITTEVVIDKWGAKWGTAFQIIATVVLIATGNYGALFELTVESVLLTASTVLTLVSQANNLMFMIKYEKKQDKYNKELEKQEKEKDALAKEYEELYKNEGMVVNMFNNMKSLDDIDKYYDIALANFDSHYLMFDYATDYDKFYVPK